MKNVNCKNCGEGTIQWFLYVTLKGNRYKCSKCGTENNVAED